MRVLEAEISTLKTAHSLRVVGQVASLRGLTLLVDDLPLPIGSLVNVECSTLSRWRPGEVVGFDHERAIVMLLGPTSGIRPGDRVESVETSPTVRVSSHMLGRIVNGLGLPIDGKGPIRRTAPQALHPDSMRPMRRRRIAEPVATGVRVIDSMLTAGAGQRLGIFAGAGVGKSTLLGSIARSTSADVSVIALVGERGREVRDFIEDALGDEGLKRSVVVVATGDESPLLRVRALYVACSIAEYFRDRNADVMLMVDSVTRFAQSQRQIGLAVGEPPATKGYTPSVFATLPMAMERAGAVEGGGSITGFYTVLVDGDDLTEPISDAVRGILDGHIVLSRKLARKGHYPAIDVLDSVSRVSDSVSKPEHVAARRQIARLMAARNEVEDLVQIGAYARGSHPDADIAIDMSELIDGFLRQTPDEAESLEDSRRKLVALALDAGTRLDALRRGQTHGQQGGV